MTATPVETAWSVIAAIGVVLTGWLCADAFLDFRAVQAGIRGGYARARGARWWIAVGSLVGNGLTAFVWAGFLVVGLIAMESPPTTTDQADADVWAGWVLIGMEALLASIQVWSRVVRLKVAGRPHIPHAGGGLS